MSGFNAVVIDLQNGDVPSCPSCGSRRQAEFTAEINIHFRGVQNLDKPGILLGSKLLVCLDCGCSQFRTPEEELKQLASRVSSGEASMGKGTPKRNAGWEEKLSTCLRRNRGVYRRY